MRIVCISDTHELHNVLKPLPPGDLLIHSGDFTYDGEPRVIEKFMDWLSEKAKEYSLGAILVAGNHDLSLDPNLVDRSNGLLSVTSSAHDEAIALVNSKPNVTYLNDSGVTLEHPNTLEPLHIWGSPIQPTFFDWAFNRARGKEISLHWAKIPENTNILITHGPPLYILDTVKPNSMSLGCFDLALKVEQLPNLKLHVFGHIHGGYGLLKKRNTLFVNAATLNEAYSPVNDIISVEI